MDPSGPFRSLQVHSWWIPDPDFWSWFLILIFDEAWAFYDSLDNSRIYIWPLLDWKIFSHVSSSSSLCLVIVCYQQHKLSALLVLFQHPVSQFLKTVASLSLVADSVVVVIVSISHNQNWDEFRVNYARSVLKDFTVIYNACLYMLHSQIGRNY